jgi:argininosuccinate lyase
LSLDEYKSSSHLFEEDVYNVTAETSIAARNVPGGTAPEQVAQQLARVRKIVQGGDG